MKFQSALRVLLVSLLVCMVTFAGYRSGWLAADKMWQDRLAEKNIITLEVSTTHTTNYAGNFKWVK